MARRDLRRQSCSRPSGISRGGLTAEHAARARCWPEQSSAGRAGRALMSVGRRPTHRAWCTPHAFCLHTSTTSHASTARHARVHLGGKRGRPQRALSRALSIGPNSHSLFRGWSWTRCSVPLSYSPPGGCLRFNPPPRTRRWPAGSGSFGIRLIKTLKGLKGLNPTRTSVPKVLRNG